MSRRNLFIGVLLFFTVVFAVAETAGITVSVDKPRPNMGDRVTIEARAMVQEGEDVTFHHQEPGSPDLVFGEPETVRESLPDGYVLFRFSRSVQPFALGTQSLGTLDVVVNGEQETRDIPELDVVPIFSEGQEKDSINPLKPTRGKSAWSIAEVISADAASDPCSPTAGTPRRSMAVPKDWLASGKGAREKSIPR